MIWANGVVNRIKAEPGLIGHCPICNEELIPKCGRIKMWIEFRQRY